MTIFYKQLASDLTDTFARAEKLITDMFDDTSATSTKQSIGRILPVGNVYRRVYPDKIEFHVNLAGMKKENIYLRYNKNNIILDVRIRSTDGTKDDTVFLKEFYVPEDYDMLKTSSKYEDGLLIITVEKDISLKKSGTIDIS